MKKPQDVTPEPPEIVYGWNRSIGDECDAGDECAAPEAYCYVCDRKLEVPNPQPRKTEDTMSVIEPGRTHHDQPEPKMRVCPDCHGAGKLCDWCYDPSHNCNCRYTAEEKEHGWTPKEFADRYGECRECYGSGEVKA
mgnify:FL=1